MRVLLEATFIIRARTPPRKRTTQGGGKGKNLWVAQHDESAIGHLLDNPRPHTEKLRVELKMLVPVAQCRPRRWKAVVKTQVLFALHISAYTELSFVENSYARS